MNARLISKSGLLFLLAIMILSFGVRSLRINAPFKNLHESDATSYGNEIRNWHRYGLKATHFFPSGAMGKTPPDIFSYHLTHWPLPLYIIYFSHKIMGIHKNHIPEWSLRIVPIIFGMLTIPIIFIIFRTLGSPSELAGLSASFAAFSIGHVYFSQAMGCNLPITLFFMLLSFWQYLRWGKRSSFLNTVVFAGSYFASLYCLWEAYYLFPTIILFHLLTGKPHFKKIFFILSILTTATAGLYLCHISLLPNADTLAGRFMTRSSMQIGLADPLRYFLTIGYRYLFYNSAPLTIASLYWLLHITTNWKEMKKDPLHMLSLSFLMLGFIDFFLFSNAYFIHEYFILSFFLFSVTSSALGISIWLRHTKKKIWQDQVVVLLIILFIIQAAFGIHRRLFYYTDGYPVSYEMANSIKQHTEFGEEILTDLKIMPGYMSFYSDSLIVHGIDSEEKIFQARGQFPERHFRYFVITNPELAVEGITYFKKLKRNEKQLRNALKYFNIKPESHYFYSFLARTYEKKVFPPFIYYDLNSAKNTTTNHTD